MILFTFGLLAILLLGPASTQTPVVDINRIIPFHNYKTLPEALTGLDQYIAHFNESLNIPALVFGLAHKGIPIVKKAYGIADLSNNIPANVDTKFAIGSISKSFAAALLGQLVDQGKVKWEDSVYKYVDRNHFPIKSWNHKTAEITLHDLLTHTAGIPGSNPMVDFFRVLDPPANVTQMILRFKDQQLKRAPGSEFEYANNGYQVLGAVIEAVTKKSYQEVMAEFLAKNKFPAAVVFDGSQVITNVPRYYSNFLPRNPPANLLERSKANYPSCPYDEMAFLNGWWPAGGLVATLDDLFHYGQLMINAYKGRPGAILSQKTVQKMWTGQADVNLGAVGTFVKAKYGYGWFISENGSGNEQLRHKNVIFHSGGLLGLSAHLTIYPDEEVVGVAMANKGVIIEEEQMIVWGMENLYHLMK